MNIDLTRRDFAVDAVDHAHAMIELTKRQPKQTEMVNQILATIEDVYELSFQDNSFDLTISLGVLQWLHNLNKALPEILSFETYLIRCPEYSADERGSQFPVGSRI